MTDALFYNPNDKPTRKTEREANILIQIRTSPSQLTSKMNRLI